ncbi:MAG: aminotransferase class III-fold pyridoxal phosphate-dependent enzyme, partial [Flavobacterium sp.]
MKEDFYKYQAQTSPNPLAMQVAYAKGSYIYDINNKAYLDFVAGVSACTLGHQHPKVNQAIKDQLDKYSHVMVYGEYIQDPAVEFCRILAENIPAPLNKTYLVNSGTEATEGALKLAKRVTGRSQLISCFNAYHGNTMGSMSVMGFEERKRAFR